MNKINDDKGELKAMTFSDGSLVLHNVMPGFVIQVHNSELGDAAPIELDEKEVAKADKADLKKVRLENHKVKDIKEDKKNDSKDVSSPV